MLSFAEIEMDPPKLFIDPQWGYCRSKESLRRIRSLGALGEGSGWDLKIRPAAPPASGNLEIWGSGNPEIWVQKNQKIQILKIQIHSAQNVGKVWISRKQILLALFGPILGNFFHGPKNQKTKCIFGPFSLVGKWALFTRFGPLLLSTFGGEIGIDMASTRTVHFKVVTCCGHVSEIYARLQPTVLLLHDNG